MRLKPYTSTETEQLLLDINFIATNAIIINEEAVKILEEKYTEYLNKFKKTLFKWKALDNSEFIKSLYPYTYIINRSPGIHSNSTFEEHFLNVPRRFYRGQTFGLYLNHNQLKKYRITTFTDAEIYKLTIASKLSDLMLYNSHFSKKYSVLVDYAHRPFEFDEADIVWVDEVKRYKKLVESAL